MVELFSDMEGDLMALTLWKRVLACIERILRILGETFGMTPNILWIQSAVITKRCTKSL